MPAVLGPCYLEASSYFAPTTLEEATGLLKEHQGDVKILAGGMSLIPLMKLRLASPGYIVDINRVKGLDYVEESDDGKTLLIGSLTRHHALESSALAKRRVPLLSEAAGSIGDSQVRNLGTIGGALAHSDPSGDWGAAILALRGEVTVLGSAGERSIPIDDFLVDTFTTALERGRADHPRLRPDPSGQRQRRGVPEAREEGRGLRHRRRRRPACAGERPTETAAPTRG